MTPFCSEVLENGFELRFFDESNRYYGDYHRVRVIARLEVPLSAPLFAGNPDPDRALSRARRWLGESVRFEKVLERMGVAGDAVASVRQELVEGFLRSSRSYLAHPRFAERLVARELEKRRKGTVATLAVHD
ncbi:MAG: hypothetical protein D6794_02315 [Deltaproteobacteria bacterium]|nr:MAG: hypothetical protein D6794_02315 [Deltaproteobacteria bacterium]